MFNFIHDYEVIFNDGTKKVSPNLGEINELNVSDIKSLRLVHKPDTREEMEILVNENGFTVHDKLTHSCNFDVIFDIITDKEFKALDSTPLKYHCYTTALDSYGLKLFRIKDVGYNKDNSVNFGYRKRYQIGDYIITIDNIIHIYTQCVMTSSIISGNPDGYSFSIRTKYSDSDKYSIPHTNIYNK